MQGGGVLSCKVSGDGAGVTHSGSYSQRGLTSRSATTHVYYIVTFPMGTILPTPKLPHSRLQVETASSLLKWKNKSKCTDCARRATRCSRARAAGLPAGACQARAAYAQAAPPGGTAWYRPLLRLRAPCAEPSCKVHQWQLDKIRVRSNYTYITTTYSNYVSYHRCDIRSNRELQFFS